MEDSRGDDFQSTWQTRRSVGVDLVALLFKVEMDVIKTFVVPN